MMVTQIELALHERQGQSITNFKSTLPSSQSNLANHVLKDPYIFDFLSIGAEAHEREKDNVLAEYTLRDINKPIGLSEYKLTKDLPKNLQTALPTIEELEAELSKGLRNTDA